MAPEWIWNPRFDLDLVQRCLTIILFSWIAGTISTCFLFGVLKSTIDICTMTALGLAIAKNSLQFCAKEKSVLITGKVTKHRITIDHS